MRIFKWLFGWIAWIAKFISNVIRRTQMELQDIEKKLNEINMELDKARSIADRISELEKEKMYWLGVRDAKLSAKKEEEQPKKEEKPQSQANGGKK